MKQTVAKRNILALEDVITLLKWQYLTVYLKRKQSGLIILREAYEGYVPLGVFNVRENIKGYEKPIKNLKP